MAGSSAGGCGTLFSVYYRVVFCWQRRYSGIFMRTCICGTYPGDHFAPKVDGVKMSCIQFFVCGILSVPFMFALETPKITSVMTAWMPILYAGVLSCGVAYTLQILGQKNVNPAVASLLLSLESCFSVLAGWIVLGERLSIREMSGCILMFVAIILAQVPEKKKR